MEQPIAALSPAPERSRRANGSGNWRDAWNLGADAAYVPDMFLSLAFPSQSETGSRMRRQAQEAVPESSLRRLAATTPAPETPARTRRHGQPGRALRAEPARGLRRRLGAGEAPLRRTEVRPERARRILTRNEIPDIPFDRSINPYRGCEHGCIYCFARPNHAYLGLSPGLDFETQAVREAQCGAAPGARTVGAGLQAAHRSRSAPTPIPTSRSSASIA